MPRETTKRAVCLLLVLSQLGCRSVYRFRCTSDPSPAGVLIGQEMMGETECAVEVPRDSELIQDGRIEFTFCLPDGREQTKVVDLRGLKPSNPLAEIVAAPFLLAGAGLFLLAAKDDDKDEDSSPAFCEDKKRNDGGDRLLAGLAGAGIMGIGSGLCYLLGGDLHGMSGREVHVDFHEPAGKQEPQAPALH